jgi:peptidoglycan hydrolase-like protein with peptidoglycan-binding domain
MAMGLYELILLKDGTRGSTVKALQEKLGVTADGQFGAGTERALKEYQKANGLKADGLAGPATLAQMKLFKEVTPETVKMSQVSTPVAGSGAAPAAASGSAAQASSGGGLRSIWDTITSILK